MLPVLLARNGTVSTPLPAVSVIVPVLNGEGTIRICLDSLMKLGYPSDRIEIVVVDNGSTDRTPEIAGEFPVKLVRCHSPVGSYAARNAGIRESSGELLAFTDSDCRVEPTWLKSVLPHFECAGVGAVGGAIAPEEPASFVEQYAIARHHCSGRRAYEHDFVPACLTANVVYRRHVFDKVGLFEAGWPSGGDIDLAWRMQMHGGLDLVFEPSAVVHHRHRSSLGGLYRQRRRTAIGSELLHAKWRTGQRRRPYLLRDLSHVLLKGVLMAPSLLVAPFCANVFLRLVVGMVVRVADITGRRLGLELAKQVGRNPGAAAIRAPLPK